MSLVPLSLIGCGEREAPPPQDPPDQLLRDSLTLDDEDQVFRVVLTTENGQNRVDPATLVVPPGAWLEFVTMDGWPRTVTFQLDSVPPSVSELLRSTGQDASPPLLEAGARFVVALRGAPVGRYPYRVEGSAEPARGVVVIEETESVTRPPER